MNSRIRKSINHTFETESKEIERLADTVDEEIIEKIIDKIIDCKGKIVITGCGTSAMAARKIVHSMNVIDLPAIYLNPSDAVHGALGVVDEKDIVIFISKGGNTGELTSFIDNVRNKKAFIITVSENEDSTLVRGSDLFLKVRIEREPDQFNMLATASTLAVISVFDAICIAIMNEKHFSRESFKLNHPGGAVGERLINNKE